MTKYEVLTLVISSFSIFISFIALMFSKKDKPNFMPSNQIYTSYANTAHYTLEWNNSSDKVVYDLTMLINMFDNKLNEITQKKIENKYYFSISNNSKFNFTIQPVNEPFFLRVRFKGKYNSWLPFKKFSFTQEIWYSLFPLINTGNNQIQGYTTYNTFDESIKSLQSKYKSTLKQYENEIDKKNW